MQESITEARIEDLGHMCALWLRSAADCSANRDAISETCLLRACLSATNLRVMGDVRA